MESFLHHANLFFEQLPDTARRYRLYIWTAFFVLSAALMAGIPHVYIDMTMEAYFQEDDPTKLAFDRFRAEFGSDEVLFLTYKARDGDVFSEHSLKALHSLQAELREYRLTLAPGVNSHLDHITDVTSLINAPFMEAKEGVLLSRSLIGDNLPTNDQDRQALRERAVTHPDFKNVFVSENAQFASIVIETDLGALPMDEGLQEASLEEGLEGYVEEDEQWDSDDLVLDMDSTWDETSAPIDEQLPSFRQGNVETYAGFMREVTAIYEKPEYAEHLEFHPAGTAALLGYLNDVLLQQMATVLILSILLILVVQWVLFHSLSAVIWSTSVVVMSFLLMLGLIGWSGATMTMMINIIIFLIIAVGVADAIHILSGYLFFREGGHDHQAALRAVFKKSGLACFLTSLTTAIGLVSLTLTPIVPVKNFGLFAAIGVFIAFLITVFVLPLMLDLWPPVRKNTLIGDKIKPHRLQRLLQKVEHVGYTYPKTIIAVFSIFSVILLIGVTKIKVDSNIVEVLPESSAVRQSVYVVDENMAGSSVMDILFSTGTSDAFKDPRMLNRMESLQQYIETRHADLVGKTHSLVNVSKDSFKTLHDDDSDFYIIPQKPQVLAQTLFMFNNANLEDRRHLVSDDYSTARMNVTLKSHGSYVYTPMIDDVHREIDVIFDDMKSVYPELNIKVTGGMSLMTQMVDYISWSQIKSFGMALAVISLLLLIVFGSKRIGFIALVPNLIPIILAFGLMGHLGISLDTDTLLIAPIIIGIAVDDTIHFLSHYRAGILQTGNIKAAIQLTIREAGQAITFTSIVLSLGFLIFLFCPHTALKNFGILSSLAILVALITDLLLLPALCIVFKADFKQDKKPEPSDSALAMQ
jgi:uncharacterized protein